MGPGLKVDRPPWWGKHWLQEAGRDEARAQLDFSFVSFYPVQDPSKGMEPPIFRVSLLSPWKSPQRTNSKLCLIKFQVCLNLVRLAFAINRHKPAPPEWPSG